MLSEIRLDAARAVVGMLSRVPGEEGYNPDGELPTAEAPIRAKAALTIVREMVAKETAAPAAINVQVFIPPKQPVPETRVTVVDGGLD